jgi:hypothetical protein
MAMLGHQFHRNYAVMLRAALFAFDRHRAVSETPALGTRAASVAGDVSGARRRVRVGERVRARLRERVRTFHHFCRFGACGPRLPDAVDGDL